MIASLSPSRGATTSSSQTTSTSPSPTTSTPSPVTSTPSPVTTTVTAQPSTQSAAPSAKTANPSGSAAASGGSGTSLLWLWILLAALAVAGLIVWITRSAGRRSTAAAGWQSRVIDAFAKGSALYDAMSVAETPAGLAADDAVARWSDIQRRADDLAQTLYALREAAPDEDSRARVADALASLQAVRSAMDAERAPGGAGPLHAQVVRDRMFAFETALRALRSSGEPL
ncbi:MAG: hypothetical protein ACRDOE_04285 [Streptosporangiaceae bacterium]